jgi:hypothetical protein
MVTMIGVVTMTALVWVLVESLARECDSERRRVTMGSEGRPTGTHTDVLETVQEAA